MKHSARKTGMGNPLVRKLRYSANCLPSYAWQRLTRGTISGPVHLIITVADHFEPSSTPGFLAGYAPRDVQEKRLENWCREYPRNFDQFRDVEGRRFNHTYFYPAEQYDKALVQQLSELCPAGWSAVAVDLHH